jgi:hypothetical protein
MILVQSWNDCIVCLFILSVVLVDVTLGQGWVICMFGGCVIVNVLPYCVNYDSFGAVLICGPYSPEESVNRLNVPLSL